MSPYVHYTEDQKARAAQTDLEEFLCRRGEKLLRSGRESRLDADHSVTIRGSRWFDHAEQTGGNAISFVRRFYACSFLEAMELLLHDGKPAASAPSPEPNQPNLPFALPPAHSDMRRVFAYLTRRRGIKKSIVSVFAKAHLIYEEAEHRNAVFVGMDETRAPRHAHLRSTAENGSFRRNAERSDARYSFHWTGTGDRLYVFEAPVDLLSYLSLHPEDWQAQSYVACCGTSFSPVRQMLEQGRIRTVFLALDNDEAGNAAAERMRRELAEQGLQVIRLLPRRKDWNEDLMEGMEEVMRCPY